MSSDSENDDAVVDFDKMKIPDVKPGMFVSGWDDPDDCIEEDPNPHDSHESEILWAANEGCLTTVEKILKTDPGCVNVKDRDGYTPLHKACYENNYEMANLLLKYNADPNALTEYKWTPLHSACKWNNTKCVALLLQHGADVNAISNGNQTPLHVAATVSNSRDTVMTLLMADNIKPDLINDSDDKPSDIARRTGLTFPVFEMGQPALFCDTGMID